ncbi:unnamed protein product [Arabis nemorensis]|uniref:Uncharacterized protein n=1 Tax=Arabis nemorensis TaxID=586526 RepID=A0A565BXZ8_9BRAS|nr:unnamed protein product [Arabis nemorensis]
MIIYFKLDGGFAIFSLNECAAETVTFPAKVILTPACGGFHSVDAGALGFTLCLLDSSSSVAVEVVDSLAFGLVWWSSRISIVVVSDLDFVLT